MKKLEETPEGYMDEAMRLEELARIEAAAGNFAGSAYFHKESTWFMEQAATMEKEQAGDTGNKP